MPTIDLNSDLGEGYGAYRCGDDEAMLGIVTSANIACGFHAGDPEIMARLFGRAKELDVAVGAHPGFPDLWGFGRRRVPFSADEIERIVAYQIGAAQALAIYAGHRLSYVKPHGALGNVADTDADAAQAIARAVRAVDGSLRYLAVALGEQVRAAERAGLMAISEIFADRGYTEKGGLIPRGQPGAMIEDPDAAAERVLAMIEERAVITASGARLKCPIGSVCVHGDSPHAVDTARRVRQKLESAGIRLAAFSHAGS